MEDQACPRCKTTKYRNPNLVLMVNVCGHQLCSSCVELLFIRGSGSCPECNIPLRRQNYRVQLLEDGKVEREVDIRRQVLKAYNRQERDFDNLEDYNDYLEEIEETIQRMLKNQDMTQFHKEMEQYKREHKDAIQRNKARPSEAELELEEILEQERLIAKNRTEERERETKEEALRKIRSKEALLDDLMFSEGDAKSIVQQHASDAQKVQQQSQPTTSKLTTTRFSSGIGIHSERGSFLPVPKKVEESGEIFRYEAPQLVFQGPTPPDKPEVETGGYLAHIKAATTQDKAGGYHSSIACLRALQEAMSGLYFVYDETDENEMEVDSGS